MKIVLFEITENGQLDKILRKWQPPKPDCSPLIKTGKPMKFEKLISLFFIILIGIILALIMLLLEYFYVYYIKPSISTMSLSTPIQKDDEVILELKSILRECDGSLNSIKCLTLILNKLKDWRRHESLLLWGLKVITNQINQT